MLNSITVIEMIRKNMDEFIGKYCKIVIREPGEERANIIFGMLTKIDYGKGLFVVESNPKSMFLKIGSIIAIKERR
jgi:hypothetical protein